MKMSRRLNAKRPALIAALISFAQPSLSDALLENGMHAGSLVDHGTTFGWFVEGEPRGLAFKAALSAQVASRASSTLPNQPDFVVFVAATTLKRDNTLNPDIFAFLTQTQIDELQSAGLGQKDCDPKSFATQSFQVTTFVTVQLDPGSSPAADTLLFNDCIRKVLRTMN